MPPCRGSLAKSLAKPRSVRARGAECCGTRRPQVSTYMGNPLGCAAGVATLEVLAAMTAADWAAVHARGQRLMDGLASRGRQSRSDAA